MWSRGLVVLWCHTTTITTTTTTHYPRARTQPATPSTDHPTTPPPHQSHHELEIPRVSYSISLYANITGIKWDYNREEGTLAGVVGDEGSQTLRAFDLSKGAR